MHNVVQFFREMYQHYYKKSCKEILSFEKNGYLREGGRNGEKQRREKNNSMKSTSIFCSSESGELWCWIEGKEESNSQYGGGEKRPQDDDGGKCGIRQIVYPKIILFNTSTIHMGDGCKYAEVW